MMGRDLADGEEMAERADLRFGVNGASMSRSAEEIRSKRGSDLKGSCFGRVG